MQKDCPQNPTCSNRASLIDQGHRTRSRTGTHQQLRHTRQIHVIVHDKSGRPPIITRDGAIEGTVEECLQRRPSIGNDIVHQSGRCDLRASVVNGQGVPVLRDIAEEYSGPIIICADVIAIKRAKPAGLDFCFACRNEWDNAPCVSTHCAGEDVFSAKPRENVSLGRETSSGPEELPFCAKPKKEGTSPITVVSAFTIPVVKLDWTLASSVSMLPS